MNKLINNDKERFSNFDGLRGIAIISVVLSHFFNTYVLTEGNELLPGNIFFYAFKYGYLGVQLFFIISGFVIAFTLYRYKNIFFFAIARFSRLYPIYWCSLILLFMLHFLGWKVYDLHLYIKSITMLPMLFGRGHLIGPYWTLEFEIIFYVIAAVFFKLKFFTKNVPFLIWLCLSVLWSFYKKDYFLSTHIDIGYLLLLLLGYAPLFIFGIYLYKVLNYGFLPVNILALIASSTVYILLFRGSQEVGAGDFIPTFLLCVIFTLCCYAVYFSSSIFLSNKLLVFCGKISYSWYLTHFAAGFLMIKFFYKYFSFNIAVAITFFNSAILAYFFYKFLESPLHQRVLFYGSSMLKKTRTIKV